MEYIKSPLNYTGGKFSILQYIIPLFPEKINRFVDLFAGGFNVGINVSANEIYANDQIDYLIEMFLFFKSTDTNALIAMIKSKIEKYHLSQSNVGGYNKLREDYNKEKNPLDLFILTCFSFNHQIRFNNSFNFNTPFGKDRSSYNKKIEENLINFCNKLDGGNFHFSNQDFRTFDFSNFGESDVVYCDPPYLITNGSYNDGKRGFGDWTEKEDADLLNLLDKLNSRGVTFFLSNVFIHKGQSNEKLIEWSKKYKVIYIDKSYSNCSYHIKTREEKTIEVLITNCGDTNEKNR